MPEINLSELFSMEKITKIAPVTITFCSMIVFNNLCLKYVHVSFYQIARSLTIIFAILLTYFVMKQQTKQLEIAAAVLITFGILFFCFLLLFYFSFFFFFFIFFNLIFFNLFLFYLFLFYVFFF